ncbi:ATP-binding cassette domain-containing protein [Evansella sp. AB-P1]|uniref:ATP-binding cassette domain-containing protein n=1 Tax=Evansella sp. AB-P1 TaxID=3037653 RepID=UPI00241CD258|nr:ATP-binding cassette domain-containing protein [Evansella sp. AB-P1]MDG5789510.1 ATP-binding cassette domain-containing protein [Evansella sp. AB-P1]
MYAVNLKNILKQFHNGSEMNILFKDMNLSVSEGELVVISGAEQSGKSTLLRLIAAMTPPNKGTIEVFGQNILSLPKRREWRVENIGFITDEGSLIPYLTAKQNLLLDLPEDDDNYMEKEKEAEQILRDLGFNDETLEETLDGLDSKEQALATVGRIFFTNPKLILVDEPTKSLVGEEGHEVLKQLLRFAKKKGSTVIMVSSDTTITEGADRVLLLENCQVCENERNIQ